MQPNILYPSHVEIAHARWRIAQELGLDRYPEQDQDAGALICWLGRLPE